MTMSRRTALLLAFAAPASLALPAQAQTDDPQQVTVALDWTPNTNHIGIYVAREKGFYAEAGLDVEILPYGDTAPGALLANGIADFGILGGVGIFTQRTAGAGLKVVYAVTQAETGRLVFDAARSDIQSPKDLDGLTYGGFGSAWENALIGSIIRHDGGAGEFETITLGTSAYEALANGSVDFTLEVSTWEGVQAELTGREQGAFVYADYGVPDQHTTFVGSSDAYLSENPEAAAAFLQATRRGYAHAVDHPEDAAGILIAANSDALTNTELVHSSLRALNDGDYLRSADGVIGAIDPEKFEAMGLYLLASGILLDADGVPLTEAPDFSRYYSNEHLPQD